MKYHISLKFLAILLATVSLLTAVGSIFGIVCLNDLGLYENSVDELVAEETAGIRRNFAVNLVHRYASLELGRIPTPYLDAYRGSDWLHSTFQDDRYYYNILDEDGEVVESFMPDELPGNAIRYEILITDMRYRSIVGDVSAIPTDTMGDSTTPTLLSPPDSSTAPSSAENQSAADEASEPAAIVDGYYDNKTGSYLEFHYQYADLPPHTVELYLLPGAMIQEQTWNILKDLWQIRMELFYILGGGLLLFAAFMAYLCCAAGRKPGKDETRAGGLNRIPLDLYTALMAVVCAFSVIAGYEELPSEMLRPGSGILIPMLFLVGFFLCLMSVCFFFACAAQFKTPNRFWWSNSILGRSTRIAIMLGRKLPGRLRSGIRTLWKWVRNILTLMRRYLLLFIEKINYACGWIGKRLARFYRMLPLIWQWLLAGVLLAVLLVFALRADSGSELLICLGLVFAIIVYAAVSFGVLLQSAKRMRDGDLETKVNDRFLAGSFQDFAEELNGLADVAMEAAQKQLRSERMKTELITNVSHDIKTPLTSIINYVDLLSKPHTSEEEKAYLEVLCRQSQRLKKLVDDLMEMSKASTGNLPVEITQVDAAEAVNQALGEFADKLEKAKLITVFDPPPTPVYMLADGRLVWRVMSNLLSNAVKYALPGTRMYLNLMQEEGKVYLSLKNISREALNVSADELLERFVRGDVSRNTEGSGLGLNIAKSLMELQNGQLELLVDGDLFKVTLTFPGA